MKDFLWGVFEFVLLTRKENWQFYRQSQGGVWQSYETWGGTEWEQIIDATGARVSDTYVITNTVENYLA